MNNINVGQIISRKFASKNFNPVSDTGLFKVSHVGERFILANRVSDGLEFSLLIEMVESYYEDAN